MREVWLSAAIYVGAAALLLGVLNVIVPIRRLRVPTRRRAVKIVAAGLALIVGALVVPPGSPSVAAGQGQLDRFHPRWQFHEFHETYVAAPPPSVYRAIKETTASEIALFQTLTAIRRFGQPGPESILNAPDRMPLLDVATRSGFHYLADEVDREVVLATLVVASDRSRIPKTADEYIALDNIPGFAKATMNFHLTAEGAGTRVTTETRVLATDPGSARRFAAYWRVIYPGSSLIRYMWLRAIRLRAERASTAY